jgi:NADPH:quinone reductase-like Zn-dependent oxidoreductase
MKAVQMHAYGGPEQLRYEEVPTPSAGAGEVLVRVAATSINPIDWKIRRGDMKAFAPLQLPTILGRDVAGEIVALGSGVHSFSIGQKVLAFASRTYAEFVAVPASALALVPDGLDLEQAGALPLVVTTGAQLIEHMGLKTGQTVLVTGAAGGVGRSAVYFARHSGARVIAGVPAGQRQQAQELQAAQVIALDSDAGQRALPELDGIADTVDGALIGQLLGKLRSGGVLGSVLGAPKAAEGRPIRVEAIRAQADAALLARMAQAVRQGELKIPIARKFKLAEAAAAQQLAEAGGASGKIVLVP